MENIEKFKTYCRIDLNAIAHNYLYTRSKTQSRVICVIKANAYGHGAVEVAKRLTEEGCDFFAVSSLEEALELRNAGIKGGVLILGYIMPWEIDRTVDNDISFAVSSLEAAKNVLNKKSTNKAKIHLKLNTGMNRTGFDFCGDEINENFKQAALLLSKSESVEIEGVFSHFACAENDRAFTEKQYSRFLKGCNFLTSNSIPVKIKHICNSPGTLGYPNMHLDAVRLGIYLYGCETTNSNYKPTMELCTRIVDIHTLKKGEGVSYGLDYTSKDKNMTIAVIGAGYADGVSRHLSNGNGFVLYKGKRCPIIGRVCMDMTMIDISQVENPHVTDEVIIWGQNLSCNEQAKSAGTIAYELLCSVSKRVHRIYI